MINPKLKKGPARNFPGGQQLHNQNYIVSESLNPWFERNDINIPVIVMIYNDEIRFW